jgi:hypothetical protein
MSNDPSATPGTPPSAPAPSGPPSTSQYPAYPPQQPYGYQQYGAPGYVVPQSGNGMGIAGGVIGIVGLVLCWIPYLGIILGALGVIFGAVGVQRANHMPGAPGKGMSIAGIVTGGIALALNIIFIVLIFSLFSGTIHCSAITSTPAC